MISIYTTYKSRKYLLDCEFKIIVQHIGNYSVDIDLLVNDRFHKRATLQELDSIELKYEQDTIETVLVSEIAKPQRALSYLGRVVLVHDENEYVLNILDNLIVNCKV